MDLHDFPLTNTMKNQMKQNLTNILLETNKLIHGLDCDQYCILCDFEALQKQFNEIQAITASYYLQQYLSPFTQNHMTLSLAAHHLSERRHGALIVIERNQPVGNLIQKGVPIGATLTSTLLESIFYPGTPLHDGAVLIKGNEIISAANVLPLASDIVVQNKIGTRHRAAIGMSQQSDALVLVVSEETGRISFSMDGILYPIHSTNNPLI
ncbi:MAG TPA: sporulation-specific diadenylate cyclase CdaS [Bacillus sp. (in: firmicutes)]|nr:sporulation-specific diadenylate cyclase CdaS [Bacillus sp. (in: firmicutes)]